MGNWVNNINYKIMAGFESPKPYEEPKVEGPMSESQAFVFRVFHQNGFEIKKIPELYKRLSELAAMEHSHFKDAVKMSKMVDIIWADLQNIKDIKFDKSELKLSCLFHDIGKSGPEGANDEQRRLVQMLFDSKFFNRDNPKFQGLGKAPKDLTIKEALDLEDQISEDDKIKIKEYLGTLQVHIYNIKRRKASPRKLDINRHTMIDFWREHDYWTWDLLKRYAKKEVHDDIKKVASTHHALEGHDPASVDGFIRDENIALEMMDKYLMITLIDKYQAWVERSNKTHEDTIQILREQIAESRNKRIITKKIEQKFYRYLEILERNNKLAEILKSQ